MTRATWLYLGARLCLPITMVLLWLGWREAFAPPRLVIELRYEQAVVAQLFYDVGSGIRAEDVASVPVARSAGLRSVAFPLPRQAVRALRFDPMSTVGSFEIGRAYHASGAGRVLHEFSGADFRPENQIAQLVPAGDRLAGRTMADANDPILGLRLPAALQPPSPAVGYGWMCGGLLCCGFLVWSVIWQRELDRRLLAGWRSRIVALQPATTIAVLAVATVQAVVAWPLHEVLDLPTFDEVNFAARGALWDAPWGHLGQFHNSPLYAILYAAWAALTGGIASAIFLQHYVLKVGIAVVLCLLLARWWRSALAAFCATALWVLTAYNTEQPYLVYQAGLLAFLLALACVDRWPVAGLALALVAGCIRQEYISAAMVGGLAIAWIARRQRWRWRDWLGREGRDVRAGVVIAGAALLIVGFVFSRTQVGGSPARMWYAFQQHYAYRASLRGEMPPQSNPWVDYDTVIQRVFPGAKSLEGAWSVNATAVARHVGANVADAPGQFLSLWHRFHGVPAIAVGAFIAAGVLGFLRRRAPGGHASAAPAGGVPLSGWLALAAVVAVLPGLVVSARDAYLLPVLPALLLGVGLVVRAIGSAVSDRMAAVCRGLAAGMTAAGVIALAVAWPVQREGSRPRPVAETVGWLENFWADGRPHALLGVEATSYAHYLRPRPVRGIEAMDTAYGHALSADADLGAQIARVGADAVLVTQQWRQSSRFDAAGIERLAADPAWQVFTVPAGQLLVRRAP